MPWMPRVPDVEPRVMNRCVDADVSSGHSTLCKPTVAKPTTPQRTAAMKQSAIFSRHACCVFLSLRPPRELRRTAGAQKVTTREKMTQASNSKPEEGMGREPEGEGMILF